MRIATIDIGTNTVLLLIAEVHSSGTKILCDEHSIARLGEGVDKTHRISEESYNRFAEIMRRYCQLMEHYAVDRIVAFATSAMRDAKNREEIMGRIKEEFDITIELLSGDDEARWSFEGAVYGLKYRPSSLASIDIGGGSTELSFGTPEFITGQSINIGAVRIKERFFSSDAAIAIDQITDARSFIEAELSNISLQITPDLLIAVAGTPTSLAAMKLSLSSFDRSLVEGCVLTKKEVESMVEVLFSLTSDELIKRYPAISPARADILPSGALILDEALSFLKLDSVRVSTNGVRYGILKREELRLSSEIV